VLNVDVKLLCGQSELTLPRLLQGLRALKTSTHGSESVPGLQAAQRTAALWKKYTFEEPIPNEVFDILNLVDEFADHRCSDDRDRIFALYALANNVKTRSWAGWSDRLKRPGSVSKDRTIIMDINYSLDVRETYINFAKSCIAAKMGVRLLEAAITRNLVRDIEDWPSWVPDWRVQVTRCGLLYRELQSMSHTFLRSAEPKCSGTIQVQAAFLGVGTPMRPSRLDDELEALFPNVVSKSQSSTCRSVASIFHAVEELYAQWPMSYHEQGSEIDLGNDIDKIARPYDELQVRILALEMIRYLFKLGPEGTLDSFVTFMGDHMELFEMYPLASDMALPGEVTSALRHHSVFVAVCKLPKLIRHSPVPLPMVDIGTRSMLEGDKLFVVGPPTKSRITYTSQSDPDWRYHAIILRSLGNLNHYRVVGEAVFFYKEHAIDRYLEIGKLKSMLE